MIWQVTRSYRTNYAPVQAFAVDHLNQLINVSRAATLRTLTAPASTTSPATIVTVEGASATLYADNTFPRAGVIITNGVEVHTAIAQASYRRSDTSSVSVTLPSWVSFERDPNGTLTYDGHRRFAYDNLDRLSGRWTYTWDAENRLVQMVANANVPLAAKRKLEFEYDWIGRRIRKTVWTTSDGVNYVNPVATKYLYDGWNLIAELDENNALVRSYIWGLDLSGTLQGAGGVGGLLAVKPATGPAQFVCYDLNGNVTALVDASTGAATAQYEYGPFGEVIRLTGSMAALNPLRFSTKYTDDESGLDYYGFRFFNPSTGRWLSRDPIGEMGGDNLYCFVGDDPISFQDFLGLRDFGDKGNRIAMFGCPEKSLHIGFQNVASVTEYAWYADLYGAAVSDISVTVKAGDDLANLREKIEAKLRPGDCIKEVFITAHGTLGGGKFGNYPDPKRPTSAGTPESPAWGHGTPAASDFVDVQSLRNAQSAQSQLFSYLRSKMCQSGGCTKLAVCDQAAPRGLPLMQAIANLTGAAVIGYTDTYAIHGFGDQFTAYPGVDSPILTRPGSPYKGSWVEFFEKLLPGGKGKRVPSVPPTPAVPPLTWIERHR